MTVSVINYEIKRSSIYSRLDKKNRKGNERNITVFHKLEMVRFFFTDKADKKGILSMPSPLFI